MSGKNIQEKIKENFINTISESSKFTAEEIEDIKMTLALTQKADKMAEKLLISIGGTSDENT